MLKLIQNLSLKRQSIWSMSSFLICVKIWNSLNACTMSWKLEPVSLGFTTNGGTLGL